MRSVSESFRNRADSAAFWEAWVGACLTRGGLYVVLQPWEIDGKDHSQNYDLAVYRDKYRILKLGEPSHILEVEVKSLSLEFNNPDDYPYDEVLVCSKNSFDRKAGRHNLYNLYTDFFLVSVETGSILWLPEGTEIGTKVVTDRERDETYQSVTCRKKDLRYLSDFIEKVKNS
jgi:hypothetical protein